MKSAPRLSRLLPILSLATLGLFGIASPVRVATAKVQIEQPEKQTDGDPEDVTEGAPRHISPAVSKPPTEPQPLRQNHLWTNVLRWLRLTLWGLKS